MLVAMTNVTNVNNMNIPEFTLDCFIFIVRSTWHIHRKKIHGEKRVSANRFFGDLKEYKMLMKERQFGVWTTVVAKGKFRNGKGNAIPLQGWTGPEGSRRLRLPDFKTIDTRRW
jgi:hypothetical protein